VSATKTHKPTAEQQAIYDEIREGNSHVVIEAVAGAGKTSTAVNALDYVPRGMRVGFFAFNRSIRDEMAERLKFVPNAEAQTIHQYGLRLCRQAYGSHVDAEKLPKLLKALFPTMKTEMRWVLDAISYLKRRGVKPFDLNDNENVLVNVHDVLYQWAQETDCEVPENYADYMDDIATVIDLCASNVGTVDYDDMLWIPQIHELQGLNYDLVIVDEAQDLDESKQNLVLSAGPRAVIFGDRNQSIYAFAGADSQSIPNLIRRLGNVAELPLTTTFRCPRSHVRLANEFVPAMQARPGAAWGEVTYCTNDDALDLEAGDMCISRSNAPLVNLAFKLIAKRKRVTIRGRNFGEGIIGLINRMDAVSIPDLTKKLARYQEEETAKALLREAKQSVIDAIEDRVKSVLTIAGGCDSVDMLKDAIGDLFRDVQFNNAITLSSIHRAKGLEADRVMILDVNRMPLTWKGQTEEEHQQERNVKYVALTRAKQTLFLANERMPEMEGE
jgi:superfamily I DNA/RNA helicase